MVWGTFSCNSRKMGGPTGRAKYFYLSSVPLSFPRLKSLHNIIFEMLSRIQLDLFGDLDKHSRKGDDSFHSLPPPSSP